MCERFKSKESKKQNIKEEKRLISSRNVFDRLPLSIPVPLRQTLFHSRFWTASRFVYVVIIYDNDLKGNRGQSHEVFIFIIFI